MSKNYVWLHSDLFLHIRTYLSGNTKVFEVFLIILRDQDIFWNQHFILKILMKKMVYSIGFENLDDTEVR